MVCLGLCLSLCLVFGGCVGLYVVCFGGCYICLGLGVGCWV